MHILLTVRNQDSKSKRDKLFASKESTVLHSTVCVELPNSLCTWNSKGLTARAIHVSGHESVRSILLSTVNCCSFFLPQQRERGIYKLKLLTVSCQMLNRLSLTHGELSSNPPNPNPNRAQRRSRSQNPTAELNRLLLEVNVRSRFLIITPKTG